jgi:hypothetical protein
VAKREKVFPDRLIIFTRYPEPGKTKTRLIPALGPEGAADLHRRMSEHTLAWARKLKNTSAVSLEVRYEGGDEHRFRQWLGSDIPFFHQGKGDLGARMARAFREAFSIGMGRIIIVGTDCPGLREGLVQEAFAALHHNDIVLGPAKDGGYYLIGLWRVIPQLFGKIPWGTGEVLRRTLQIADDMKLRVFLLEPLGDVDHPEDLGVCEKFAITPSHPSPRRCEKIPFSPPPCPSPLEGEGNSSLNSTHLPSPLAGEGRVRGPLRIFSHLPLEREGKVEENLALISVIIPTLNEEENIAECLASTQEPANAERIVVDGGSRDRTIKIALACGARVLTSPAGRARQMNAGAEVARGDLFLFLHADTRLPEGFANCVRQTLAQPGVAAGAFQFRLDVSSRNLQIIERVANWRSRRLQMPYGDQAIFIRSALFREIGGFPEIPIMEDCEFIRRLKKKGRILTLPQSALTSARRWRRLGIWKTTLINELVLGAYYLGFSPSRIHRFARRNR